MSECLGDRLELSISVFLVYQFNANTEFPPFYYNITSIMFDANCGLLSHKSGYVSVMILI